MYISVMENAGISTGNPPACQTPLLTDSARSRKCRWQGLISLQVFTIAMTGRPVKSSCRWPSCFRRERWPKPRSVSGPNQRKLRRSSGFRIHNRFQNTGDRFENIARGAASHDLEIAVAGVMVQHRARAFPVSAQAFANHVLLIVLADDQRRAIVVAAARNFWAFRKN